MPTKKRGHPSKATAATAATAATPTKSTRATAPIITNNRGKEIEATAAASRPKRDTAATASAAPVQKRSTTKKRSAPKEDTAAKRGPGRPRKSAAAPAPAKATTGKKRGRPAKVLEEDDDADDEPAEEQEPPKKKQRGRPSTKVQDANDADDEPPAKQASTPAKRGRGRPPKNKNKLEPAVPLEETAPPKHRDGGQTYRHPGDDLAAADQLEEELMDTAESPEQSTVNRKGKAPIPKKGKGKAAQLELSEHSDAAANGEVDESASGKNYWLMKAEEKGHDIPLPKGGVFNTTFTIDDLRSKTEPEAWDGVRSHGAAKNMRDMKKGDLAFFYASGGKNPGIVGIMEIVKEHEPDPTQFDEDGPNYEQKDQARGKWCVVHVEFRKKLNPPVFRHVLQEHLNGGPLAKMQEFTAARLSVSKVSEAEWNFITENLIQGYEANGDDDGEADATADLPTASKGPQGPDFPGGIEESEEAVRNDSVAAAKATSTTTKTAVPAVVASTEVEPMMTDIPDATSATSRPASRAASRQASVKRTNSRGGSRAGSVAPPATSSRIASRANSLAPPDGRRARSRTTTPKATAASVV